MRCLPRISVPLTADAHASLLALMSKWKGAHILSVEQFDEPMLLELFGAKLERWLGETLAPVLAPRSRASLPALTFGATMAPDGAT